MVKDEDKEKFIDILLVVIGLVFAGTSNRDELFNYAVFGFLTFAIATRAWMTFNKNKKTDLYKVMYILFSSIMSVSFPLVFVSYFFTIIYHVSENDVKNIVVTIMFAIIATCLSFYTFISFFQGPYSEIVKYVTFIGKFFFYTSVYIYFCCIGIKMIFAKSELVIPVGIYIILLGIIYIYTITGKNYTTRMIKNMLRIIFIKINRFFCEKELIYQYLVLVSIFTFILLINYFVLYLSLTKNNTSVEVSIHNASVMINNATVTITNTTI